MVFKIDRYDWVDTLRGYAIILVLMIHTSQIFVSGRNSTLSPGLQMITRLGDLGVMLFFIVSSFTLFNSFDKRSNTDSRPVLFFLIRRLFRIAPMYWTALMFYFAASSIVPRIVGMSSLFVNDYPPKLLFVIVNALFLNGLYLPSINYLPPGGWTIGVEMLFYLSIPYLYGKIRNLNRAVLFLISSILGSFVLQILLWWIITNFTQINWVSARSSYLYFWLPNQFPVFVFGIVLFYLLRDGMSSGSKSYDIGTPALHNRITLISILLFISLAFIPYNVDFPNFMIQREYLFSISFLLFACGISGTDIKYLNNSFFRSLGKVSFSTYLIHFAVVKAIQFVLISMRPAINPNVLFVLVYISVLMITFSVAKMSYRIIEKNGIIFGERLIEKLKMQPPAILKKNQDAYPASKAQCCRPGRKSL